MRRSVLILMGLFLFGCGGPETEEQGKAEQKAMAPPSSFNSVRIHEEGSGATDASSIVAGTIQCYTGEPPDIPLVCSPKPPTVLVFRSVPDSYAKMGAKVGNAYYRQGDSLLLLRGVDIGLDDKKIVESFGIKFKSLVPCRNIVLYGGKKWEERGVYEDDPLYGELGCIAIEEVAMATEVEPIAGVEVHAYHILVATEQEADGIIEKLNNSKNPAQDFQIYAQDYSIDKVSAKSGGDLGWFGKDVMHRSFEDAVFALKPGEFTKAPVKTSFGYHVIYVQDRKTH